jgi:CDP-paratose 2-epimerase
MRHYLITGGAGFIGSNVADCYLSKGGQVTILDNFSRPGSERNLAWLQSRHGSRLRVVRADICEMGRELIQSAENAEVIFHLAAQVAVTTSVTDPRHDFEVNALGTFHVLEAARQASSKPIVVYSSTNKVYGKLADLGIVEHNGRYTYRDVKDGIDETRPLDPYSPYGCSKCAGDEYVLDYARIYGLKTLVFRQSCIYGPRQFGMEDQGWLAWFAIRALQQKPVTVYGDGKQVRDVLHVDDLIAAYDAALSNIDTIAGQAYNIGGGPANTLSLLELIGILNWKFGRQLPCSFADWRPGDQPVFVTNIGKAKADFGWQPRIGVEQGVEQLIEWLSANRSLFESAPQPVYSIPKVNGAPASPPARPAQNVTKLSVIIPAKDEEETLGNVLEDLNSIIPTLDGYEVEVICVDDHSRDRTAAIARAMGARVVENRRKPGKGNALRAGFEAATGDLLLMMDADYSHRPEDVPGFLSGMREGVGLVIGSRVFGGSDEYTHVRALGNVFLSGALGLSVGRYLSDALNGYKLFRRDVFTSFAYTSPMFEIEIEIIANTLRKGYRVVEVVSHERARAGGEMKSRVVRHGTRFLLRIIWEGIKGVKPAVQPEARPAVAAAKVTSAGE